MSINCATHRLESSGFIVCVHVIAGAAVAHYIEPTDEGGPDGLGEVLCAACHAASPIQSIEDLKLVCAQCVRLLILRE